MQAKQKIVIVEDEAAISSMYDFKLRGCGYDVKIAKNGIEGLEIAETFRPDLILLDIMMPEMDGCEMLEKLRQTDWGARIRVIILTNLSKDEAPHRLRFLNVDRYVVKAHHTPAQVADITNEVLGRPKTAIR